MSERPFDAIVLGAGPGGYVCAIRLAQLGKKVAVVEDRHIGGVCLNVGCIPSKALISAGSLVKRLGHAGTMGITAENVRVDMEKLQAWKQNVVERLTGGVATLFDGYGVTTVTGRGRLVAPDRMEVTGAEGPEVLTAPSIVLAPGSRPIEIPDIQEATPLGAAILAGIGVGLYADEQDAYEHVRRDGVTYQPDAQRAAKYQDWFPIYRDLYPSMKEVNHRLFKESTT